MLGGMNNNIILNPFIIALSHIDWDLITKKIYNAISMPIYNKVI
jgi:hypothetical protein